MALAKPHALYTLEEYVRLEEYANIKHEFFDGQMVAMAGGTPEHSALAVRLAASLVAQLRDRRCRVHGSDARVRVAATGLDTYPDISVVCGREERDSQDRNALSNPVVLVEVLSPSTEAYDRGEKLEHYKQIPTLREVVLVAHDRPLIEVWARAEERDAWHRRAAGPRETIRLESIACLLDVDDLYRDPLASSPD